MHISKIWIFTEQSFLLVYDLQSCRFQGSGVDWQSKHWKDFRSCLTLGISQMKMCWVIKDQTKDLTWKLGMKKLTLKNHLPLTWVVERDSTRHWKQRRGSLFGFTTSVIVKKELTGRIAEDAIYTDRVECLMRRTEAAAWGYCFQCSCSSRAIEQEWQGRGFNIDSFLFQCTWSLTWVIYWGLEVDPDGK